MPTTVPLETFVVTLHVPRTIADAEAAAILKSLRRKSFRKRLRIVLTESLKPMPAFAPVTVSVSNSP